MTWTPTTTGTGTETTTARLATLQEAVDLARKMANLWEVRTWQAEQELADYQEADSWARMSQRALEDWARENQY